MFLVRFGQANCVKNSNKQFKLQKRHAQTLIFNLQLCQLYIPVYRLCDTRTRGLQRQVTRSYSDISFPYIGVSRSEKVKVRGRLWYHMSLKGSCSNSNNFTLMIKTIKLKHTSNVTVTQCIYIAAALIISTCNSFEPRHDHDCLKRVHPHLSVPVGFRSGLEHNPFLIKLI